jgi:hypothetical protein
MIPTFILQTWLLGLLSLGIIGGAVYFAHEWQQRSWVWDPVLERWFFAPDFGSNDTMLLFIAVGLIVLALAGGTIVQAILRLTARGAADAKADPRRTPKARSQQRLSRPDGSELQIEFYGPEDGTPIVAYPRLGLELARVELPQTRSC